MFTFIKKVIKTGTQTSRYPLEPMPVDKNFRGKPEHNPQQCIGCAACVNACPSNALTVETDLKTRQLANPALYAARQHGLRRAADHRQPRPVLLLHRPHDRGGRAQEEKPGGAVQRA